METTEWAAAFDRTGGKLTVAADPASIAAS